MLKVIIAGGRNFKDYKTLRKVCDKVLSEIENVIIVSGKEPNGADKLGEKYAKEKGFIVKEFPADWNDLTEPCVLRTRKDGTKYNALSGFKRNYKMAEYADALIAFWDGESPGTKDMIEQAKRKKLQIKIHKY